ncbi:hypothetical protein Cgig2_003792 [Carnegiea gigantea]|uniref:UspA domain-containing protein n=1 Tax=Carnegiea gigantea TaxID=171969 RepID=A0A9Q1JPC3_9CARY|nr:hypothetical protein Cgig2_003792 [Carnegiea gigantea]
MTDHQQNPNPNSNSNPGEEVPIPHIKVRPPSSGSASSPRVTVSTPSAPGSGKDTPTAGAARKIAIAVDLSDESAFAVKWAVDHYIRPGDAVVLLHVRPTSVLYGADWGCVDLSAAAPDNEESHRKLEDDFDAFTTSKAADLAQPLIDAQDGQESDEAMVTVAEADEEGLAEEEEEYHDASDERKELMFIYNWAPQSSTLAFSRPENTLAFSQTLCSSLSMAISATNLHFRLQPQISRYESPFLFLLCCEFFFPSSSSVVSALFVAFRLPFGCCSCFFSSSFSCSAMSVGHGGVFGHLSLSLLPPIAVGGLGGEWAASSFFFSCALGRGRPDLKPSTLFFFWGGGMLNC